MFPQILVSCDAQDKQFDPIEGGCMITLPSGRVAWKRGRPERKEYVHVSYTSRLMEAVPFKRLVINDLKTVIGEKIVDWLDDVVIGWRYCDPIGAKLCKSGQVFKKFKFVKWEASYLPECCQCGVGRHAEFLNPAAIRLLPADGCLHVITSDMGITNNGQLQLMLNAGLNHIPMKALNGSFALEEVEQVVDCILATNRCDMELSMEEERKVKKVVMKSAEKGLKEYRTSHRHITEEPFNNIAVRSEVEWLTKRFLVCPTDKAPHTPTFVRVNFIRRLALARVSRPDFVQLLEQPSTVAAQLKEVATAIAPIGVTIEKMPLPHLMVVYKGHKESFKWITNTAGTMLSEVANVCACLRKFMSHDVQALCASKSDAIFNEHGVGPNYWWPIASVGEFMANLPRHVYSVFTGDITRCFETIPTDNSQDGLISAIKFFVQSAMEWRRARTTRDAIAIMIAANDSLHLYWVDSMQNRDHEQLYFDEEGIVKACE
ncbi:hypothetical protein CBR_g443 [Chara braunii]|uniref:Uncharacterized protein n=1 Tax=Chara braunii TaxID=69332 RepID=A0A388KB65_CHABU|nr:hypothetical protein CBR_g443 [Chara braunii]|eukprot:GBG67304.1 hypothetical protein CBR_g443 [Chara braunii]